MAGMRGHSEYCRQSARADRQKNPRICEMLWNCCGVDCVSVICVVYDASYSTDMEGRDGLDWRSMEGN